MLSSHLKLYRLPEKFAKEVNYKIIEARGVESHKIRDYVAHLNGEPAMRDTVDEAHQILLQPFEITLPEEEYVNISTRDGEVVYSKGSLMRRFHFFDDFFSTFPDNDEVEVPFTTKEVYGSIYLDDTNASLSDCLLCMKYFNPKCNNEYFQLVYLGDISDSDLLELVNNLTEDDVVDLIEAREDARVPLPRSGRDRPALACILEVFGDEDRLIRFFSAYPSYLFCVLPEDRCREILMKTDFSKYNEYSELVSPIVFDHILMCLGTADGLDEVRRFLAMLGLRSKNLGNEGMSVVAPYYFTPPGSVRLDISKVGYVRRNLMNLFGWNEMQFEYEFSIAK